MAQYNRKNTSRPKPYVISEFGGLDPGGGDNSFVRLENFRIDGSRLKKRGGARLYDEYPADIRGMWYGDFDGESVLFCVSGSTLYRGSSGEKRAVGTLSTSSGKVCMFFLHGCLYLLDGADFYECDGMSLKSVTGYIPTIRLSGDENFGTPYYDRNRLNRTVRMQFTGANVGDDYPLYGNVASIVSVTLNGSTVSYTVSGSGESTKVSISSGYGTLLVTYRLVEDGLRSELCSQLYSLVYSSLADDTVFLYGGKNPSRVFYSGHVDGKMRIDYFPIGNVIDAGTGDRPVTALLRQYDSVLLFTSGETYMTEPDDAENENGYRYVNYPLYMLNPNIGCICDEGARQADDSPVSVSRDGVWRWTETDTQGERTAKLVSRSVDVLLTDEFILGAKTHISRRYGEFWMHSGTSVLVYAFRDEVWYMFTGIDADGFIETEDTCCYKGRKLFIFDESTALDDGVPFTALAETGFIDFGSPHLDKRLHRVFVTFDASDGECSARLELSADSGDRRSIVGLSDSSEFPITVRMRGDLPRFCFMRLTLSDDSGAPMSLKRIGMQYSLLSEGLYD